MYVCSIHMMSSVSYNIPLKKFFVFRWLLYSLILANIFICTKFSTWYNMGTRFLGCKYHMYGKGGRYPQKPAFGNPKFSFAPLLSLFEHWNNLYSKCIYHIQQFWKFLYSLPPRGVSNCGRWCSQFDTNSEKTGLRQTELWNNHWMKFKAVFHQMFYDSFLTFICLPQQPAINSKKVISLQSWAISKRTVSGQVGENLITQKLLIG